MKINPVNQYKSSLNIRMFATSIMAMPKLNVLFQAKVCISKIRHCKKTLIFQRFV